MKAPDSGEPGTGADASSGSGSAPLPVDTPTALTLLALTAAVAIVLWRAEAAEGYGPFASTIAGVLWLAVWTLAVLGLGRPVMRCLVADGDRDLGHEVLAMIAGSASLTSAR